MYYRARWYDQQLGKFLNDDPMGFAAGDANVSRYVGNSARRKSDPTGLWPPDPALDPNKVLFYNPTEEMFVKAKDLPELANYEHKIPVYSPEEIICHLNVVTKYGEQPIEKMAILDHGMTLRIHGASRKDFETRGC